MADTILSGTGGHIKFGCEGMVLVAHFIGESLELIYTSADPLNAGQSSDQP